MADAVANPEVPKKKGGLLPLLVGGIAVLVVAAGGFFFSFYGFMPDFLASSSKGETKVPVSSPDVSFVPLDPILVSLAGDGPPRYIRMGAQLEVPGAAAKEVAEMMPRILDILNGYLRVLSLEEVQKPTALLTIRAHLLRRAELVLGPDRVHDLLITEFVVN